MSEPDNLAQPEPDGAADEPERAQIAVADVESAGRSCLVIVALVIVILALLSVWVVFTAS